MDGTEKFQVKAYSRVNGDTKSEKSMQAYSSRGSVESLDEAGWQPVESHQAVHSRSNNERVTVPRVSFGCVTSLEKVIHRSLYPSTLAGSKEE